MKLVFLVPHDCLSTLMFKGASGKIEDEGGGRGKFSWTNDVTFNFVAAFFSI